jgi:hypothetical protein
MPSISCLLFGHVVCSLHFPACILELPLVLAEPDSSQPTCTYCASLREYNEPALLKLAAPNLWPIVSMTNPFNSSCSYAADAADAAEAKEAMAEAQQFYGAEAAQEAVGVEAQ